MTIEIFDLLFVPPHSLYTFGIFSDAFEGFSKSSIKFRPTQCLRKVLRKIEN